MGSRWCGRAAGGAGGLQEFQEGCRWCRGAAAGAGVLLAVLVGGGCVLCFPVPLPAEALQAHAPDQSVAATLHRRGSGARGITSRSSVSLSPLRRGVVLVRLGPRLQAYPWFGLARSSGHGGLAAHAQHRRVPGVGRNLCRCLRGSH